MSELQQLLKQIESSYQAARRALTSPAIMAPHEFITKRMEEISMNRDKIAQLIGDEFKATDMVVQKLAEVEGRS